MTISERIDFKKTKPKELVNKGFTCVDMHYHTKYSDGSRKVSAVAKKAKKLGIGVAITDHNEIRGAIEISKYNDLLSVPGIEATTKEGIHLLYYFYNLSELQEFYNHNILPNKDHGCHFLNIPFVEFIDLSKDYNCVFSAPHPYGISWTGICCEVHQSIVTPNQLCKLDAVEVINGSVLKHMNQSAVALSESINKGITAGSDGHRLFELGKVLTYTKYPADREDFLKSIKKQANFVIGKETNIMQKIAANSTKINVPMKHPIIYAKQSYNYIKQKSEENEKV
jgi:predicted metal-dependent phosphoesterase TrpH